VDIHEEEIATAMVRLLLRAGAEPDSLDDRGATPLSYLYAYHPEHHSTVALLKQAKGGKADVEEEGKQGQHHRSEQQRAEKVEVHAEKRLKLETEGKKRRMKVCRTRGKIVNRIWRSRRSSSISSNKETKKNETKRSLTTTHTSPSLVVCLPVQIILFFRLINAKIYLLLFLLLRLPPSFDTIFFLLLSS